MTNPTEFYLFGLGHPKGVVIAVDLLGICSILKESIY